MGTTGTSLHALMTAEAMKMEPRKHTRVLQAIDFEKYQILSFKSRDDAKSFLKAMKNPTADNTNSVTKGPSRAMGAPA